MITLSSTILCIVFLFLSAIHIYWATGGKWGANGVIPTKPGSGPMLKPGPFACIVVACGLMAFALFTLIKAEILPLVLPQLLQRFGLWIIAALFLLRAIGDFKYIGLFKKVKTTHFAKNDTHYFTPLCLAIVFLAVVLERSIRDD